jgi:hypothetical protein
VRYGFTTECKQLVPDQAEREVTRRIHLLHRGGLSTRKIADQLIADQVPANGQSAAGSVADWLRGMERPGRVDALRAID